MTDLFASLTLDSPCGVLSSLKPSNWRLAPPEPCISGSTYAICNGKGIEVRLFGRMNNSACPISRIWWWISCELNPQFPPVSDTGPSILSSEWPPSSEMPI
ncbi:unnamed protein product [Durusdinium trenchii]|uniref:Uncharacterized protein n=1 Tax=Durusdinium trenchii TaxID=1381693 RepID=A0ABP0JIR1_9DINO